MEIKIVKQTENPLLGRKEIEAMIQAEVTPSNAKVKELLTEKFKANAECIVIKHIYSKFGFQKFKISAYIYDSIENLKKFEPKKKEKKAPEKAPAASK